MPKVLPLLPARPRESSGVQRGRREFLQSIGVLGVGAATGQSGLGWKPPKARQVVLDTETTGLSLKSGHRIIEIAAIELEGRKLTGRYFHRYANPERKIDAGATAVHGLTLERLREEPTFAEIASELCEFIGGAELIIHNAPFDTAFLNREFELAGLRLLHLVCPVVIDTLAMARERHPGKRNHLDALCNRYNIDNSHRTRHGALLDADLLAQVYLAMTRSSGARELP
jgi:DNA polymerase-3 subunit epsilon